MFFEICSILIRTAVALTLCEGHFVACGAWRRMMIQHDKETTTQDLLINLYFCLDEMH